MSSLKFNNALAFYVNLRGSIRVADAVFAFVSCERKQINASKIADSNIKHGLVLACRGTFLVRVVSPSIFTRVLRLLD